MVFGSKLPGIDCRSEKLASIAAAAGTEQLLRDPELTWAHCSVALRCGNSGLLAVVGADLEVKLKMGFPGCVASREDIVFLGTKLNWCSPWSS